MNDLAKILTIPRHTGYPTEYLLARLKARKVSFTQKCTSIENDAWSLHQQELCWIYNQMECRLRSAYAPVFIYFELPALFTALRFKSVGNSVSITNTLRHSLICNQIKKILTNDKTFPENIKDLSEFLRPIHQNFTQLEKSFQHRGLIGVERTFFDTFICRVDSGSYPKAITDFLHDFETRRNVLTLAKQQDRQLKATPSFAKKVETTKEKPSKTLNKLLNKHPEISGDPARLDALLLQKMRKKHQRLGRVWEPFKQITSHLCGCYFIARDAGLKPLTGLLGETKLSRETTG